LQIEDKIKSLGPAESIFNFTSQLNEIKAEVKELLSHSTVDTIKNQTLIDNILMLDKLIEIKKKETCLNLCYIPNSPETKLKPSFSFEMNCKDRRELCGKVCGE
jgi:hypothetical protein